MTIAYYSRSFKKTRWDDIWLRPNENIQFHSFPGSEMPSARQIFFDEDIWNFVVPGNRLAPPGFGIPINGMRTSLPFERTPVCFEVSNEFPSFQASSKMRTSSVALPRESWRRSSISNKMASFKLCKHSSEVRPWPLASGTSGQNPTYHSPSRCTSAVNFKSMKKTIHDDTEMSSFFRAFLRASARQIENIQIHSFPGLEKGLFNRRERKEHKVWRLADLPASNSSPLRSLRSLRFKAALSFHFPFSPKAPSAFICVYLRLKLPSPDFFDSIFLTK